MLVAPTSYQGAKQRIAAAILDRIDPRLDVPFFDLCCGSGAVSIELLNRGFNPRLIYMVDAGPWGLFWQAVAEGQFDLNYFAWQCNSVPKDRSQIKRYMENLALAPVSGDAPYTYLLLQSASFGGKAIWIEAGRWQNCSFRSFWQPTATSNRRSPVNPMMPMPESLFKRVKHIVERLSNKIQARCQDVRRITPPLDGTVYIDPPYQGTTGYGHSLDVVQYAAALPQGCHVSEGRPLSPVAHLISKGRAKGGISAARDRANEEWLSVFVKPGVENVAA